MVILYNEEQLREVRKFCVTKSKNLHLLRLSTQGSPIMLGPIFLHWDGECSTDQRFFSHLRTKLNANIGTEIGLSDIIIGSDEEIALLKAVHQRLPSATQILCEHHLEEMPSATYCWSP